MPCFIHHLFAPGTPKVLDSLAAEPRVRPFLYHVTSVADHPWFKAEVAHGVGQYGLAVVRPLASPDSKWMYGGESILDWSQFDGAGPYDPKITPILPDESAIEESAEMVPPVGLLRFIHELSVSASAPFAFYSFCSSGEPDFEAAWVFEPAQSTHLTKFASGSEDTKVLELSSDGTRSSGPGDALRKCMAKLGVVLPTWYFAPHASPFSWDKWRYPV